MPFQTQLALSLELAKVFPIREALNNGVEQLANLVRALKRNGSDFLSRKTLLIYLGGARLNLLWKRAFATLSRFLRFSRSMLRVQSHSMLALELPWVER